MFSLTSQNNSWTKLWSLVTAVSINLNRSQFMKRSAISRKIHCGEKESLNKTMIFFFFFLTEKSIAEQLGFLHVPAHSRRQQELRRLELYN